MMEDEPLRVVEYLTRTMIEPKRFVFDYWEDSTLTNQYVFSNTLSAEVLTIEKRNCDYVLTSLYINKTQQN